jgi:PAS domain S-box-containing protein
VSQPNYQILIEAIPLMVWTADATGTINYWNQHWYDYTGLSATKSMGSLGIRIIHPEDQAHVVAQWHQSVAKGNSFEIEYRIKRWDGTYQWFLCRGIPTRDAQGQTTGWMGILLNITEQKQTQALQAQLFEQEQAARKEAERANRLKDEFLAILSHELRNPLNPILGWAELLQTRKFSEAKTARALATIERNARLQAQLIDDLLDTARILRGKLIINLEPTNLVQVVKNAIDTVRTAAEAKSISLQINLLPINKISGDVARLQQIVWNLLSNAIKFTPKGGRVEIRLEEVGKQAQITVTDTGKGICADFLDHVFESFRQENALVTRHFGGLGLGLAIVQYLVEAHGGTITAYSPGEGLGSTFRVRLPLLQVEPRSCPTKAVLNSEPNLSGIRVLAVDDEPDARDLLKAVLTTYGAEVKVAASALEALAIFRFFQPDVLISDIGMPEVDGYTLIQRIRTLPPEAGGEIGAITKLSLKAIALSAYAREEDSQQALESGYQVHLAKPLEPKKLVQAVAELVNEQ